ncbi:hypothetical protein [Haloferula sp. BvORR071]|uniref:hypothetical protein n=1 Tax=Haloferula sp. BvORR071 TaxID=1396141 RepID=UPI00055362AE|nr:hypothetical protein [Haloferula sp. BvORR071]
MLPQRRKSAEEIAKLREAMGVPGAPADGGESAAPAVRPPAPPPPPPPPPVAKEAVSPAAVAPAAKAALPATRSGPPEPHATDHAAKVRAHAERVALEDAVLEEQSELEEDLSPVARLPKTVRSLRKSEQGIVETRRLDPEVAVVRVDGAALPQRRHDERELMAMRRIQQASPDQALNHIGQQTARWYALTLGYLLPALGILCAWLSHWLPTVPSPEFPTIAMAEFSRTPGLDRLGFGLLAGFGVIALLLAGWIAWKKPRSRHHAGFITIIGVLILVFGIIHQFTPNYGA